MLILATKCPDLYRPVKVHYLLLTLRKELKAQTLANVYQALDADHEMVTVLNKMDLPAAEPDRVKAQIEDVIGLSADNAIAASAKTGLGIEDVLEAVVTELPAPQGLRPHLCRRCWLIAGMTRIWGS